MAESISRDDIDAAWLAGIWDGEGCIHTSQRTKDRLEAHGSDYRIRLELRNTNPYLMQRVTEILTKWNVKYFIALYIAKHSPTKRETLVLVIQSYRSVKNMLDRMLPYLTAKRDEGVSMLEFCDWRLKNFSDQSLRGHSKAKKKIQQEVRDRIIQLHSRLRLLKRLQYRLQRLPRGYSGILDLAKLEVLEPE